MTEYGPVVQAGSYAPLAWERSWVQVPPGPPYFGFESIFVDLRVWLYDG